MMLKDKRRFWNGFWQLADPKIWVASTVPMFVGLSLVIGSGHTFNLFWFSLALLSIYFIEIGKNAVNEWVDYRSGVDLFVSEENKTPFSGGKKTIIENKLTLNEVGLIAIFTLATAFSIGLAIVFLKEFNILWIGLLGMALAVFYSLPPFKFSYRGLGELVVGITFGPLMISGVFVLMTGVFEWWIIPISLPIAFLISNVLWINQYPDYEADLKAKKRNGLVRIGKKKGIIVYALLFMSAYGSLVALTFIHKNPFWLLGLITIPFAISAIQIAAREYNNVKRLIAANELTVQTYLLTGILLLVSTLFGL